MKEHWFKYLQQHKLDRDVVVSVSENIVDEGT